MYLKIGYKEFFNYFNIIKVNIFHIDNIIEKVISSFFMFISLTLLLIFNLYYQYRFVFNFACEMVINIFILLEYYRLTIM